MSITSFLFFNVYNKISFGRTEPQQKIFSVCLPFFLNFILNVTKTNISESFLTLGKCYKMLEKHQTDLKMLGKI